MSDDAQILKIVKPKYYKILKRLHPGMTKKQIAHVNLKLTIVDEMNSIVDDVRLAHTGGILDVLQEITEYYAFLRDPRIVMGNSQTRPGDDKELIFFWV